MSPKMSPKLDPYLGRRQKLTSYSTLGRPLNGVFLENSERLQIGLLLGTKPGAGRPRENLFDHIVEMTDLINSNLRLQ